MSKASDRDSVFERKKMCEKTVEVGADQQDVVEDFHLWDEAKRLLHVALPSVAIQFNLYFIFPQSAAYVGKNLGTEELAGFSLGSLIGNLSLLSVIIGALSAADTLMPRAYGAENYVELGHLAIRGLAVCSGLLLVPAVFLMNPLLMESILEGLGQDPIAATFAAEWLPYYLIGVPANMAFRLFQRFLAAQHEAWPHVYASLIPTFLLHPIFLRFFVPRYGLPGSAVAVSVTQWLNLIFLFMYVKLRPIPHPESWPRITVVDIQESLSYGPLCKFLSLSVAGVASLSEWWFWETMCFIAGSFGIIQLCAHTIAYNIIPLCFMLPLGVGIGLTVRMGAVIAFNAHRAKLIAFWTMALVAVCGLVVAYSLHFLFDPIVQIFTADPGVVEQTKAIWPKVCYYIFVLYIFGTNSAILRALGLQWRMAAVIFLWLWIVTLPLVFWFAVRLMGGLAAQWTVLPACYTLMQVVLVASYARLNWAKHSSRIRNSIRHPPDSEGNDENKHPTEETALL